MPSYTLEYFNLKARGELIRLVFAEAGVKFEDKRIDFEDWPKHKPNAPFGQVPVLKIDDKPLPQSGAIVRYLAREFNLCGDNSLQAAYADMLLETLNDNLYKFPFMEKDEKAKKEKTQEALEKHVYPTFDKIEKKFKSSGNDFIIVKDKLTFADLAIMHAMDIVSVFDAKIREKYPTLEALCKRVEQRPGIKAYLKARKSTPF